jgi:hypothetical protein
MGIAGGASPLGFNLPSICCSGKGHYGCSLPTAEGRKAMKKVVIALSALSLLAGSAPSLAAACRNKAGKFVKCPPKPKSCRDSKGHFIKCK